MTHSQQFIGRGKLSVLRLRQLFTLVVVISLALPLSLTHACNCEKESIESAIANPIAGIESQTPACGCCHSKAIEKASCCESPSSSCQTSGGEGCRCDGCPSNRVPEPRTSTIDELRVGELVAHAPAPSPTLASHFETLQKLALRDLVEWHARPPTLQSLLCVWRL